MFRTRTLSIPRLVIRRVEQNIVLRTTSLAIALGNNSDRTLTRIVSLNTHDSCAAYATPPALGKLANDSGPPGRACISPRSAISKLVLPDAVGPIMRLVRPRLNRSSPSISRTKRRPGLAPELVEAGDSMVASSLVHVKEVFLIPSRVSSCSMRTESIGIGSCSGGKVNSSRSSVCEECEQNSRV